MDMLQAPKTKAQYLLQVLSELKPEQQKQVIDFAVFLANE